MRARRRYMPEPRTIGRRTTVWVAGVVLAGAAVATLVLERRGAERERRIMQWVDERAGDPVATVINAARGRRIVLLGDVMGAPAPKRFAAAVIDSLARARRLDVVALEVSVDQQTWIDLYLETNPEDATVLLAHPRALREGEGTGRALLDVYRAVWRANSAMGADRRIRIVAIDAPDWPPAAGISPARALAAFAQRDSFMVEALRRRVLERNPGARVLIFADGVRAGRSGARLATGGAPPFDVVWLAERLRAFESRGVLSVLVDARPGPGATRPVAGYQPGWLHDVIRARMTVPRAGLGLRVPPDLDLEWDVLGGAGGPGIRVDAVPPGLTLADLIDVYVLLPF